MDPDQPQPEPTEPETPEAPIAEQAPLPDQAPAPQPEEAEPAVAPATEPVEPSIEPSPEPAELTADPVSPMPAQPAPAVSPVEPLWDKDAPSRISYLRSILIPKAIARRRAKREEAIMRLAGIIQKEGRIDYDRACRELEISDTTANRYFHELERRGLIEHVPHGPTGYYKWIGQ